jgi:hypothetical protein
MEKNRTLKTFQLVNIMNCETYNLYKITMCEQLVNIKTCKAIQFVKNTACKNYKL